MTQALRVFYRKSDSLIVWTHHIIDYLDRLIIPFPTTIEEELTEIPLKVLILDGPPLGGSPQDYACIEIQNSKMVDDYFASDNNTVVNSQLLIGPPRPEPSPDPDTIRASQILAMSPPSIPMPELWELLRIIGKKLGYIK